MRALLFETRTGDPVIDLERSSWSYDTGILAPDDVSLKVPGYTPRARSLDLRGLLTPLKYSVALVDDSVTGDVIIPAAGFIVQAPAAEDVDGLHEYSVKCAGLERLFEWAHVREYPGWPLLSGGKPSGTYDMNLSGLEYGTIMKRLLVEAMKWPGFGFPIDFEADRSGARERNYLAVDGKPVLDAVDDLADLINGVEYDFQPYLDSSGKVRFRFVTGTDADRLVSGPKRVVLNVGGVQPDVSDWVRDSNPADVATDAVFAGGKGNDQVLLANASSTVLTDAGWPRREVWDSSHSSVEIQSTLQGWADGRLQGVTELISFKARFVRVRGLRHGDVVDLHARGHWDMPDGVYERRVLSVARSSASPEWVDVQLVGTVS